MIDANQKLQISEKPHYASPPRAALRGTRGNNSVSPSFHNRGMKDAEE